MKYIFIVLMGIITLGISADDTFEYSIKAKMKNINDGDTAYVSVRFYGIDTPEKKQMCENSHGKCYACGETSKTALINLLDNKEVTLKLTGDSTYGRIVGSLERNGVDLNLEMVKHGHAVAYLRYLKGDMKKRYSDAQDNARSQKKGIWQGKFIKPEEWRRGKRLSCEKN